VIPRRLIRSVPERTTAEVETFWERARELHPGWEHTTFRDPIDPAQFPLTSPYWPLCTSGAQLAGLVRLEALWATGGVWLDSDMDMFRPLTPLLGVEAFAAWEDEDVVPDAVIGARPQHPAIYECLELALFRLTSDDPDWRTGSGAWGTGPGVTTTIFPDRCDVLLLPPESFYPVHYSRKERVRWSTVQAAHPWAFGAHRWHASWVK
jgi:mannosyltransferase OCH1-like enzyme